MLIQLNSLYFGTNIQLFVYFLFHVPSPNSCLSYLPVIYVTFPFECAAILIGKCLPLQLSASEFASLITTLHGPLAGNMFPILLRACLLGFPRDRYLASPLARWLLLSMDHIENTAPIVMYCCVAYQRDVRSLERVY
jgi:hypothetical protein